MKLTKSYISASEIWIASHSQIIRMLCFSESQRCEFESRSWPGVFDTTLYDQVCQ
jgi:hypothetical protein